MKSKKTIGLLMFVAGMILQEVSYIIDLWMLRVIGGIVWPIGMLMFTSATISINRKKQNDDLSQSSIEEDKT